MAEAKNHITRPDLTDTPTPTAVQRLVASDPEINAIKLDSPTLRTLDEAEAALEWKKREKAIEVLYKAFCNSELVTDVQLANGNQVRLTAWQWQEAVFWREMILSGVVRASAGEWFAPYERREIFIKAFRNWFDRRVQSELSQPTCNPPTDEASAIPVKAVAETDTAVSPPPKYATKKDWIDAIVSENKDELAAMEDITAAARHLHNKSKDDPDCPDRPAGVRYIEKIIRGIKLFPPVPRGNKRAGKHS